MEYPFVPEELKDFEHIELIEKCKEVRIYDKDTMEKKAELIQALQQYIKDNPEELVVSFHKELIGTVQSLSCGYKYKISRLRELYTDIVQLVSDTDIEEILKKRLHESFDAIASEAKEGRECLKRDTVPIVVVGDVSSGKSTFINNWIGEILLPAKQQHTTSVICRIRYSTEKIIRLATAEGKLVEEYKCKDTSAAREYLNRYAAKKSSTTDYQYDFVDILWPVPFLKDSLEIVDTPGMDENTMFERMVADYIKNAASVIYIVDAYNAGGLKERNVMNIQKIANLLVGKNISENGKKSDIALFVLNKWDLVNEDEKEEIMGNNLKVLQEHWPNCSKSQVIPMDSRKGKAVREVAVTGQTLYSRSFRTLMDSIKRLVASSFQEFIPRHERNIIHLVLNIDDSLNQNTRMLNRPTKELKKIEEKKRERIQYLKDEIEKDKSKLSEDLNTVRKNQASIVEKKFSDLNFRRETFIFEERELPARYNYIYSRSKVCRLIQRKIQNVIESILTEHERRDLQSIELSLMKIQEEFETNFVQERSVVGTRLRLKTDDSKRSLVDKPLKDALKVAGSGFLSTTCTVVAGMVTKFVPGVTSIVLVRTLAVATGATVVAAAGTGFYAGISAMKYWINECIYHKNREKYIVTEAYNLFNENYLRNDGLSRLITKRNETVKKSIDSFFDTYLTDFLNKNEDLLENVYLDILDPGQMDSLLQSLIKSKENLMKKTIIFLAENDTLRVKEDNLENETSTPSESSYQMSNEIHVPDPSYRHRLSDSDIISWINCCNEIRRLDEDNVSILGIKIEVVGASATKNLIITPWQWGLSEYLMERREKKELPIEILIKVAQEITHGLAFLHGNGLTHRCLTGANVKVSKDKRLKLLFTYTDKYTRNSTEYKCLSGKYCRNKSGEDPDSEKFDEYPVLPIHLAPEFLMGIERLYTKEADMYSLGILLWEITYDTRAFISFTPLGPTSTMREFVDFLYEDGRPQPHSTGRDNRNPLERIIESCWHKDKNLRNSASEVLEKLEELKRQMYLYTDAALCDFVSFKL